MIGRNLLALSISLLSSNLLIATAVPAADSAPLPLKKITVDASDQVVIEFGSRNGAFPSPPHVLDLPGPNHRVVIDFTDSLVDKMNMPSVGELSTRLHKLLPAIKSVHYSNLGNAAKPTARVVIEVPEQMQVQPRVVKLEEDSVTITLGDHVRDNDLIETKPVEPLGTTKLPKASQAPAKPQASDVASIDGSGLEMGATANAAEKTAAPTEAPVPALATDAAAGNSGPTNANWDWTSPNQANASGAVTPAVETRTAEAPASAQTAETPATPAAAQTTEAQAATKTVEAPAAAAPVVAQAAAEQAPAPDLTPRTHGSAPIVETYEKLDSSATVVQPGASTTLTPGAAAVLEKPKQEEPKPVTVADTDAKQFQDALRPAPPAAKEVADADPPLQLKPAMTGGDSEVPAVESGPATSESPAPSSDAPAPAKAAAPAESEASVPAKLGAPAENEAPAPTKAATPAPTENAATTESPAAAETAAAAPAAPAEPVKAPPLSSSEQAAVALYNSAYKAQLHGKIAEAIADYKGAIAANPHLADAHSNLGVIYNQQHNFAQALVEFRKALAINPKDAITYNGIGAALRAEKDRVGALKNYQTAVNLDPHLATAHYNLGTIYEELKDTDKAMDSYKLAVKNDYRLGEAYYQMGKIMGKKKRNDEAVAYFKEALKVGSKADYSDDAREQIALLLGSEKTKTK